jgi:hypothetical protein
VSLPIVSARITNGKIGIDWSIGRYAIRTRPAELDVTTVPTKISAPTRTARMDIDFSASHKAIYGGKPIQLFIDLQSQMPGIAQQSVRNIVRKWERIGNAADGDNPIPDVALEEMRKGAPDLQVYGPASHFNFDILWDIPQPDAQVEVGRRDIEARTYRPEIEYYRGAIDVYLKQRPQLSFEVIGLDIRV